MVGEDDVARSRAAHRLLKTAISLVGKVDQADLGLTFAELAAAAALVSRGQAETLLARANTSRLPDGLVTAFVPVLTISEVLVGTAEGEKGDEFEDTNLILSALRGYPSALETALKGLLVATAASGDSAYGAAFRRYAGELGLRSLPEMAGKLSESHFRECCEEVITALSSPTDEPTWRPSNPTVRARTFVRKRRPVIQGISRSAVEGACQSRRVETGERAACLARGALELWQLDRRSAVEMLRGGLAEFERVGRPEKAGRPAPASGKWFSVAVALGRRLLLQDEESSPTRYALKALVQDLPLEVPARLYQQQFEVMSLTELLQQVKKERRGDLQYLLPLLALYLNQRRDGDPASALAGTLCRLLGVGRLRRDREP